MGRRALTSNGRRVLLGHLVVGGKGFLNPLTDLGRILHSGDGRLALLLVQGLALGGGGGGGGGGSLLRRGSNVGQFA